MNPGRVKAAVRRLRREMGAVDGGYRWFRAGYGAALDDMDRTGRKPLTDATIRESADKALKRWVDG